MLLRVLSSLFLFWQPQAAPPLRDLSDEPVVALHLKKKEDEEVEVEVGRKR